MRYRAKIVEDYMPTEPESDELARLRQECERLRRERDALRGERDEAARVLSTEAYLRLQLLAETLSREIKDRFLASLRTTLWVATVLLAVATAGGLWKLSDLVSERIDSKIKEKEQDVAQVRQQIITSVVDFERQARASLDQIETLKARVAQESDQATGEIRQAKARVLAFQVSAGGEKITVAAQVPETAGIEAWFGDEVGKTAAVAASRATEFAFEDPSARGGAFSIRFQRAIRAPAADGDGNDAISVEEAVALAANELRAAHLAQNPVAIGHTELALFSREPSREKRTLTYKVVRAVVIGIDRYREPGARLNGAVNDANGFAALLKDSERSTFGSATVNALLDEQATEAGIRAAIEEAVAHAGPSDVVAFYFSGHVATIGPRGDRGSVKALFPFDGDVEKKRYLKVADIVAALNRSRAKAALLVIDG